MKIVVRAMAILLLAVMFRGSSDASPVPPALGEKVGGGKVADFEIDDVYGKTVKFSDFKDKVLIIQHMSPGCTMCNKQIEDTMALREKYGKENLKAIAFIFDGTFNNDKDRERNRERIKMVVEKQKPVIEGQSVPKMDYDAYVVWSYAIYAKQQFMQFKHEPLLTCIVDKEGNYLYRKTDANATKEEMDAHLSKILKPADAKKGEDKKDGDDKGKKEGDGAEKKKEY